MAYWRQLQPVHIKLVRILDFYLTLGRIRISIPGLNPELQEQVFWDGMASVGHLRLVCEVC